MPFGGLFSAAVMGGTSLLGGLFGSHSASKAAQQQLDATNKAAGTLQDFYKQNVQSLQPYQQAGQQGLSGLQSFLAPGGPGTQGYQAFAAPSPNSVSDTPEFKFAAEQGQKGLDATAAAHGHLLSGGSFRDAMQFNQGLASQQYQNAFNNALGTYNTNFNTFNTGQNNLYNRLYGLAGIGQQATGTGVQATAALGTNLADLYTGAGNAQAAGTVGQANAWTGALGNGANTLATLYSRMYPPAQQPSVGDQYRAGF